jgi:polyphosphate kinase 2 (PPK2 family)
MRAYHEINDFEEQLADAGAIVAKFWMAVTPQEQLRRFKEREKIAYKRFKITDEDWRNRKKWPDYEKAICDMIERTSTEAGAWTLVAANDKLHARVAVIEALCDRIEARL